MVSTWSFHVDSTWIPPKLPTGYTYLIKLLRFQLYWKVFIVAFNKYIVLHLHILPMHRHKPNVTEYSLMVRILGGPDTDEKGELDELEETMCCLRLLKRECLGTAAASVLYARNERNFSASCAFFAQFMRESCAIHTQFTSDSALIMRGFPSRIRHAQPRIRPVWGLFVPMRWSAWFVSDLCVIFP